MEKLKIKCWDDFSDFIYFEANFYQNEYIFLVNKNFKTEPIKTAFKQLYVYLDKYLDLKYFKIEIL